MRRLIQILGNTSIRLRILLYALALSLVIAGIAFSLSEVSKSHIQSIRSITSDLDTANRIRELDRAVRRYVELFEIREVVSKNSDQSKVDQIDSEIAISYIRAQDKINQIGIFIGSEDVFLVSVYLSKIREKYFDLKLRQSVSDQGFAFSQFRADTAKIRLDIENNLNALSSMQELDISSISDKLDDFRGDYLIATSVSTTFMLVSSFFMFFIVLYTVSRPLNNIINAISNIDDPEASAPIKLSGPSEFVAISKAFSAHLTRIKGQKAAEERLRDSEARFRRFAESSADLFWEMDEEHMLRTFHSKSRTADGGLEWTKGQTLWQLAGVDLEKEPRWRQHHALMQAREPFRNFEFCITDPTLERSTWWRVSGMPTFSADGMFQGYSGTASDITEQRQIEDHLRRAQSFEAIGQLTGGVAHDFNNLLAVLRSNLELIDQNGALKKPFSDMITRCLRATERGSKLTGQLLSLASRQDLKPEFVAVEPFLEDFCALVNRTLPDSIIVSLSVKEHLPPLYADPGHLQDALLNLVINARDAIPNGGEISITALQETDDESVSLKGPNRSIAISVQDNGDGIPENIRDRIFEPFFSTKNKDGGSGLGLSMVRGFVEQSGGRMSLESRVNSGTRIILCLPAGAATASDTEMSSGAPTSLQVGESENILLVEDDDDVRASLEIVLHHIGFSVITSRAGDEALTILEKRASEIRVLISDISMPGAVQGDELATIVRRKYKTIGIILISGHVLDADGRPRKIPESVPVLMKPVPGNILKQAIYEQLNAQSTSG